jgi:hypothetical protein
MPQFDMFFKVPSNTFGFCPVIAANEGIDVGCLSAIIRSNAKLLRLALQTMTELMQTKH